MKNLFNLKRKDLKNLFLKKYQKNTIKKLKKFKFN